MRDKENCVKKKTEGEQDITSRGDLSANGFHSVSMKVWVSVRVSKRVFVCE